MANVLGTLFGDIAGAIREKTGDADTMKPAEFPEKILGIETGIDTSDATALDDHILEGYTAYANGEKRTGTIPVRNIDVDVEYSSARLAIKKGYYPYDAFIQGKLNSQNITITENGTYTADSGFDCLGTVTVEVAGAGAEDVRYVTFFNEDGTIKYGKKAVATGDDCADPIARGVFDTPTKESTAQYDHPFSGGWATTPGGGIDANALKAVIEDRTVYANFLSVLRSYNARFFDGDTLLATVPTYYGAQAIPPEVPGKQGYYLKGWIPEDLTVYSDTDFVADWAEAKGYAYVTTLGDFPNEYIADLAFNKDGTHVAVGMSGNNNAPFVYDISGNTPALVNHGLDTASSLQRVDYSYDGSYLYGTYSTLSGTSYSRTLRRYPVDNGAYGSPSFPVANSSGTKNCVICRCSPVSSDIAYGICSSSETKMNLNGNSVSVGGTSPSTGEYSPDGTLFAVSGISASTPLSYFTNIYNTSDGSLVNQIVHGSGNNGSMESFNKDGSLIAIRNKKAPYVSVYRVSTGEKVYSFDDLTVSTGACCFVRGTNELIVSEGTTIRAFDFSAPSEPVEIENVPDHQRTGTPYFMRSSADGRMVGIMSRESMDIEIWKRL